MDFNKFLSFDELIAPTVIKGIYILGSLGVVFASFASYDAAGPFAILILLGGLLAVRLYCELIIVLFKISANVSKIASRDN